MTAIPISSINLSALTFGEVVYANGNFNYFNGTTLVPINTGISTANTNITALQTSLTNVTTEIATANTNITALQQSVSTDNTEITTITTEITALQTSLTTVSSSIVALQASIATINTEITALQAAITPTPVPVPTPTPVPVPTPTPVPVPVPVPTPVPTPTPTPTPVPVPTPTPVPVPTPVAGNLAGQAGNPVGFAAAPNYPGSLKVWTAGNTFTSGTASTPTVYSFYDFQSGTNAVTIGSNYEYITFVGCRFQSNAASAWPAALSSSNVLINGASNITFSYCSFTPLTSLYTTVPGATWPCAGAGTNSNTQIAGTNCIAETAQYTYGLNVNSGGPVTTDHCDFWGFGNFAIGFQSGTTAQMTVSNCWLHDGAAEGSVYKQHQDAIGYLDGGVPCQNITIENCTIAGMGNTNAIAFQGPNTASYANIIITGNYLSGYGYTCCLPGGAELFSGGGISTVTGTLEFNNNTFGTDIPWIWGPLYAYYQENFTTATWFNNKFNVLKGSTPATNSDWSYSFSNNGDYIWPNSTFNTTDWPGNAPTPVPVPTPTPVPVPTPTPVPVPTPTPVPVPTPVAGNWPGQASNPVGFAAAPNYPGSLTTFTGTLTSGTASTPTVYSFYDFNGKTSGTDLPSGLSYVTFIGCRFQSNSSANYNVQVNGASNIIFSYCSFTPLASLYTAPPGAAWPSAGAGMNTTTQIAGTNCIAGNSAYGYGLNIVTGGPITADHCDFWGFGNGGPLFYSTTAQMIVNECWIHDACDASPQGYHQDGTGYLNGKTPPANVTIQNCTIASIGNTNALAWQGGSSTFNNINHIGNYISGFGYTALLSVESSPFTNSKFVNNTFGTDIQCVWGPFYANYVTMFSGNGNTWSGNKINVVSGTTPASTANLKFTAADNGLFLLPDSSFSAVDFVA